MDELRMLLISMKEENKINFAKVTNQLDALQSEFASMKSEVEDLKQSVNFIVNEVNALRDETIPVLRQQLNQEIADLKKARVAAELYSKKSNLLFHGIEERVGEDTELVLRNFLTEHVKYDEAKNILFANVHRLPTKNTQGNRPNPIIAKFVQIKVRNEILSKASILKDSAQKFGISPHLPAVMQQARSKLVPIRQQAIKDGKRAVIKTTGIDVKLYINDELYKP